MSVQTAPPSQHQVLGRTVTMPVEIRVAQAWAAQYLGRAAAAREILEPAGLVPLEPVRGRALMCLGFVRYVDGDLGPYHEFLVALMARRPGTRGRDTVGAYIHWLPVNGEFTCAAGRQIWGFPKEIADIEVVPRRRSTTCTVRLDGRLVVALDVGAGLPAPAGMGAGAVDAYTFRDGALRRTPWQMRLSRVRTRPGGARVTLGDHPISRQIADLGLGGRAFATSSVSPRMTFGDAETIG